MADTEEVTTTEVTAATNGKEELRENEEKETKSPVKTVKETDKSDEKKEVIADGSGDAESPRKEIVLTPELEMKIIRQMEFYFGDMNLARDRFMQTEIKENDGWLTMETMLKFNRLKNLCDDAGKIVEAVKKSTSGLLELSEDGTKIRRNPSKSVPSNTEERRADLKSRTCYVKHFPSSYTMDDLLTFFDKHCSTELIQLRRDSKREFKGSVFVVFPTKEEAKKFIAIKDLKVGDEEPILKMLKDDYFDYKMNQKKKGKKPEESEEDKEKKEAALEEEEKLIRGKMTKGAILHLIGIAAETTREDIKKAFGDDESKVAWIDFDKGDSDSWIRFDAEDGAKTAWDENSKDNKIVINDQEVRADVLEGEVEFSHWKNIFQSRADRNKRGGRTSYRGRGRGGRGGRGAKGRRGGGRNDGGPAHKRARRD